MNSNKNNLCCFGLRFYFQEQKQSGVDQVHTSEVWTQLEMPKFQIIKKQLGNIMWPLLHNVSSVKKTEYGSHWRRTKRCFVLQEEEAD